MASKLHILISGAGIAGLMTGALLEKAGISYEIFEKAKEVRPLGSTMTLSNLSVVIFKQLGLYEGLLAISKPNRGIHLKKQSMNPIGSFLGPGVDPEVRYGDHTVVVARPDVVQLLMTLVPARRILYNKRILSTSQDEYKVVINCADNTSYEGSILIGADGAYSSVRQNMYKELEKAGKLPKEDAKPLGYDFDCVVGVSTRMDDEKYPVFKDQFCDFEIVLGTNVPYTWWSMPLSDNRMGWMVTQDIRNEGTGEERNFRFSEWGPDAALEMCNKVRDLPSPYGGVIGDIFDQTPKERISKVMLEDKYFSTWYHGRTVLLGDACHKMLPFGGQGANMAILGAVQLVNLLFDIYTNTQEEITQVFQQYFAARSGPGKAAVSASNSTGYLMHKKGMLADFLRYSFFHWVPSWVMRMAADKYNAHQLQISFLPYAEQRGTFRGKLNPPSRRMVPGSTIPMAL
ncbi:hypothetical protein CPB97_005268 [Podila verticillata]|nr:hypothetical protein CPB97_005268 [Podila verticillata]